MNHLKKVLPIAAAIFLLLPAAASARPHGEAHHHGGHGAHAAPHRTARAPRPHAHRARRPRRARAAGARHERAAALHARAARTRHEARRTSQVYRHRHGERGTYESSRARRHDAHGHRFSYRGHYHARIHGRRWAWPGGYHYRHWSVGALLPAVFVGSAYFYSDYAALGLEPPPPGYAWVRYGPDLVLVNVTTRIIRDIVHGVFF